MRKRTVTVGILGNMGPEADELFQKLLRLSVAAKTDQDHIPVAVVKNPNIPDRTAFIMGEGPDPVPEMLFSLKALERAGAHFVVMPCNTAHFFLPRLQQLTALPILDMPALAAKEAAERFPGGFVGVLATHSTVKTGLYTRYLQQTGLRALYPEKSVQERCVHAAIYGPLNPDATTLSEAPARLPLGIKAGVYDRNAELLATAAKNLAKQGAACVLLACTELPLVRAKLEKLCPEITFLDPMESAAKRAADLCREAERLMQEGGVCDPVSAAKALAA